MPYFVWQKILSAHCQLGRMIFIHYIRVERSKSTTRMQKAAWFVLLIHLGRRYLKKKKTVLLNITGFGGWRVLRP